VVFVAHEKSPVGPGYQVSLLERIRHEAKVLTGAVGLSPRRNKRMNSQSGQLILLLLAREMLRDPYWPLHAAATLNKKQLAQTILRAT